MPKRLWPIAVILAVLGLLAGPDPVRAQDIITTVAGTDWIFPGGGPAADSPIGRPTAVAADGAGNVYISDHDNFMVMKVDPQGVLTVLAGNGFRGFSGDGSQATTARMEIPWGVAADAAGNVYFADVLLNRVRVVRPDGTIETVAGNGQAGSGGDGGPGPSASLNTPQELAVDSAGNLYIADGANHRIRRVDSGGVITTFAGTGQGGFLGDGGPAASADFAEPAGLAIAGDGSVYIADKQNHRIRRVSPGGIIDTVVGNGTADFCGDGGPALDACLNQPNSVDLDSAGRIYISDFGNNRIRVVDTDGTIRTLAGNGTPGYSGDGGPATAASLDSPTAVLARPGGDVLIADFTNERVRRVDGSGTITTFAGNNGFRLSDDGIQADTATFHVVPGIALDSEGNLFLAEDQRARVRKVSPDGVISTVAGNGIRGYTGENVSATGSVFFSPNSVAIDPNGNLYVADNAQNRVRKITPGGQIVTVAGTGEPGYNGDGIPATQAALNIPQAITLDGAGNLYICDQLNHRVRKVATDGTITTIAGTGEAGYNGDGIAAASAMLNWPTGVHVNAAGNMVWIAERFNHRVRRIDPDGTIRTIVGNGSASSEGDGGPASLATVNEPAGVYVDPADGSVYIAELGGGRIRRISADGIISRVAGIGTTGFSGDGGPALDAELFFPTDVEIGPTGTIYIADAFNSRVRAIAEQPPLFSAAPDALSFAAQQGDGPSARQQIVASSSVGGLEYGVSASTDDGGSWLKTTSQLGVVPAAAEVFVDPAGLAAGAYTGSVALTAPGAAPPMIVVPVTLTVTAPEPPKLIVEPSNLSFSLVEGREAESQSIRVINAGGGELAFETQAATDFGGDWLAAQALEDVATPKKNGLVQVSAAPRTPEAGVYTGKVLITSPATGQDGFLEIELTVRPQPKPIMHLSHKGLTFRAVAGGVTSSVLPQEIGVLNVGEGVLDWTVSASVSSGGNWLSITPSSGSTDATSLDVPRVKVQVNAAGLSASDYEGVVEFRSGGQLLKTVTVRFQVLPQGTPLPPIVRPTGLIFTNIEGRPASPSQSVSVFNPTLDMVRFNSNRLTINGVDWFQHLPTDGTLGALNTRSLTVQPENENRGLYEGAINFIFPRATSRFVNVLLLVLGANGASALTEEGVVGTAQTGCTPTQLFPIFTSVRQQFSAERGLPFPLEARVVDDCGQPMRDGSVLVSFSNGEAPLSLTSLRDGSWSGTWAPTGQPGPVVLTLKALGSPSKVEGEAFADGVIAGGAGLTPAFTSRGVVNASSFQGGGSVSPGGMISIFGIDLADATTLAQGFPLPFSLNGVSVRLGDAPLPLLAVSAGQINAIVPFDAPVGESAELIVERNGRLSLPAGVSVANAQPGIFTMDASGTGQGAILGTKAGTGEQALADAANPVSPGDALSIYCAGLGPVDNPPETGLPAPLDRLVYVNDNVRVTVGGQEAQLIFAGLAPGLSGVYQVNAYVPEGVGSGDVAVQIFAGSRASNTATVAVR